MLRSAGVQNLVDAIDEIPSVSTSTTSNSSVSILEKKSVGASFAGALVKYTLG